MQNEIEKEFFELFKISPRIGASFDNGMICTSDLVVKYPEITSDIVLELIAICSGLFPVNFAFERGAEEVKENTLKCCIWAMKKDDIKEYIYNDIRVIFGEEYDKN